MARLQKLSKTSSKIFALKIIKKLEPEVHPEVPKVLVHKQWGQVQKVYSDEMLSKDRQAERLNNLMLARNSIYRIWLFVFACNIYLKFKKRES